MAQLKKESVAVALCRALRTGDADRLRACLTSPEWKATRWDRQNIVSTVMRTGDVQCLRVLHDCGFAFNDETWESAAIRGHVHFLQFAVNNNFVLSDMALYMAVNSGKLACVEFLLQLGLPTGPYAHLTGCISGDKLKCIQMVLEKQVTIDTGTLIQSAEFGELELVRWLHGRGVPLWRHARDEGPPLTVPDYHWRVPRDDTIVIPRDESDLWRRPLWEVLRYGAVYGAPVTPRVKRLFQEKQQRTRAVLLCFKAAARLCRCPGPLKQRRRWASMAAIPAALIEEVLISADLEIRESIRRPLLP